MLRNLDPILSPDLLHALRAMGQLALAESFVPETTFSPIELLKMKGKQRQRAAGSRDSAAKKSEPEKSELDW